MTLLMERTQSLGELIPCGGGDPIPLLKAKLLVGRRNSCDISLRFPNVSSHHCELELVDGYWRMRDLNSRNGIKVNGARCDVKWLMPGDVVTIAKHHYEVTYEPVGEAPPPEDANPFAVGLLEKAGLVSVKNPEPQVSDQHSNGPRPEEWQPDSAEDDPVMKWLSESGNDAGE
ncbi:MAG: FHA domain-containing protein, partial [Planctomycetaceae bacterium]